MSTVIQRSFAYGELAPEMRAKADLNAYSLGLKTARNVVVGKAGGIFNRPGTISLTKGNPLLGSDARILGRAGNYIVTISYYQGVATRFLIDKTGAEIGSRRESAYLDAYHIKTGDRILGTPPPYAREDIAGISITSEGENLLLCHQNYAPLEIFISDAGTVPFVDWRIYTSRRPAISIDHLQDDINYNLTRAAGDAADATVRYAIAAVDEFGVESELREPGNWLRTTAPRSLNADSYFILTMTLNVARTNSTNYNIYKRDLNGEYRLLGIITAKETGAYTLQDIGQELGDETYPRRRPDITPLAFNLSSVAEDYSAVEGRLFSYPVPLVDATRSPADDVKASFFAVYEAERAGNYNVTETTTLTLDSHSIDTGLYTLNFPADITSLFTDAHIENMRVDFKEALSTFFIRGFNPRFALQYQDRRLYAATDLRPDAIWFSKLGSAGDFSDPLSINDSSPFSFNVRSNEGGRIMSLLDLNGLYIFGSEVIWRAYGNEAGVLSPTQINIREVANFGASSLPALKVGTFAFVEQQGGGIIRAISPGSYAAEDSSSDISLFSNHFIRSNRIVSWTFAKRPVPIIWMVRDDGQLLSLTFESSQGVSGWCKHDFSRNAAGARLEIIDVTSVDGETFLMAKNQLSATETFNHIMKLDDRFSTDDVVFTDNSLITEGTELDLATASPAYKTEAVDDDGFSRVAFGGLDDTTFNELFNSDAINNYIFYEDGGSYYADRIATIGVAGVATDIVVERRVATTHEVPTDKLIIGVKEVELSGSQFSSGLPEFAYSVVADGNLIATNQRGLGGGRVSFDRGYRKVTIGHPITSDIETLDIDLTGPTISQSFKKITEVNAYVDSTLGLYAGNSRPVEDGSVNGLALFRPDRKWENNGALEASEGLVSINIDPTWNSSGAVFMRQIDPLPLAIYSISPSGSIPSPGSGGI